ncbi:hypothetical protein MAPG_08500 [Magnaporthiopsis poae ATCC 64411]|uniref:Uncharacterized protein n=1 Tax=Magnaporthiopsis poae (strain ATCC 64411 / 73-15) TaxID=644358 RepID=A0A0C4E7I7_MAGP6|nr:hypothetical protein MAPG_08500 [Magnaporthiopsis poae ATCC 64411]
MITLLRHRPNFHFDSILFQSQFFLHHLHWLKPPLQSNGNLKMHFFTVVVALFASAVLAVPALEVRQKTPQIDTRCTLCRQDCFFSKGDLKRCLDSSCNVPPLSCGLSP